RGRRRKHEGRHDSSPTPGKAPAENTPEEAPQRQRVVGQFMILVETRNDSRCSSERFTELRRVDLQVRSILVGDAEPIAGEATVGHDVAEKLIERRHRPYVKAAGSVFVMERLGVNTQSSDDVPQGSLTQRPSEGVGLENVA